MLFAQRNFQVGPRRGREPLSLSRVTNLASFAYRIALYRRRNYLQIDNRRLTDREESVNSLLPRKGLVRERERERGNSQLPFAESIRENDDPSRISVIDLDGGGAILNGE